MALFEGYERRMPQLQPVLEKYGFKDFDELKAYNNSKGVDAYKIVEGIQPIAFENAVWAYYAGAAIAIKSGAKKASDAAAAIGNARPWPAPQSTLVQPAASPAGQNIILLILSPEGLSGLKSTYGL